MKRSVLRFIPLLIALFTVSGVQAENDPQQVKPYQHQGKKYPPVYFITNIKGADIKQTLEEHQAFAELDEDAIGAPLAVIAWSGLRMKQDATGFSSLMLSAGTLGIIPIVSNKEYKVGYFVYAGGELVDKYIYSMTSADVENIWAGPPRDSDELKPAEQVFAESTVTQFLHEIAANEELAELFEEYYLYAPAETQ